MKRHDLKIWPQYFRRVLTREKTCEVRNDDRGFAVGDILLLREFEPKSATYTGRWCDVLVTHIMLGGHFGVAPGYVVMSIALPESPDAAAERIAEQLGSKDPGGTVTPDSTSTASRYSG